MQVKLTVPFIKNVELPQKKQIVYFDTVLKRFGLWVFPSGRKTFFVKYQNKYGQTKWLKVSDFQTTTLDEARKEAVNILNSVDKLKEDPAENRQKDKNAILVSELCDWYFKEGCSHKKDSTIQNDKSRIENFIKPLLGKEPVVSLTKGKIITMMNEIIKGTKVYKYEQSNKPRGIIHIRGGKGAAARTIQTFGAMMQFAVNEDIIQINPVNGIEKPKDNTRDIFLTLDEIKLLGSILKLPKWATLHELQCDLIKLILLTGCRKSEITTLKWEYIDFNNQVFHFPDTKTGKQDRPFGTGALNLLKELKQKSNSEWVFPSTRGNGHLESILKLLKQIKETKDNNGEPILNKSEITLHSLRHTFATIANELGYTDITIAALLGHHISTVTSRYVHKVDKSLILAANDVSTTIEKALQGE